MFDRACSWWTPQRVELPDSNELDDKLQEEITKVQSSFEKIKDGQESSDEKESTDVLQNPWHTGVHQTTPEEIRPSQQEEVEVRTSPQPQLRKSTRQRKPNPKYANVAVEKDDSIKEPETFEEAIQHNEW